MVSFFSKILWFLDGNTFYETNKKGTMVRDEPLDLENQNVVFGLGKGEEYIYTNKGEEPDDEFKNFGPNKNIRMDDEVLIKYILKLYKYVS